MIYWIASFFILSCAAAALGFGGLTAGMAWVGQGLLFLFVVALIAGFAMHVMNDENQTR